MDKITYIKKGIKNDMYLKKLKETNLNAYCEATPQAFIYYMNKWKLENNLITEKIFLERINYIGDPDAKKRIL